MTIEAMKQALEALVGYELVYGSDEKDREAVRALRQAIEQASSVSSIQSDKTSDAEKQEPVAYIDHRIHGWPDCIVQTAEPPHTSPLYTTPPAAPVQKPIEHLTAAFRALAPHCTMHDIARFREVCRNVLAIPPAAQRQWVGLTDEEIIDVLHPLVMADMPDEATDYEIAKAIEAKLKEKNHE